ncbi:MAG TPA: M55 family metallopeptidase [Candidatus Limnocylindrales bacterium]|jgi:D-amino peptidase|nr:M55 family metallopeptidase [Candidatus Limnocylindrales bacterium]
MRVYLSVDMEGVAGISHPGPTDRGDELYPAAVELMTGEANAAIEGALAGGAEAVVVNDSHGSMFNLSPARLHPDARLVQGQKPLSMVEAAADGRYDVCLYVGYHARAGHPRGTIAHTYSGRATLTTLNGRPVGEYGINALYLGALGVPVGLVAGDDALAEEVAEWLPWAERVVVKRAVGGNAADSLHPERARGLIRAGAQRAVEKARAGELQPLRLEPPIRLGIEFRRPVEADFAAVLPGLERGGDRGVRFESDDPIGVYRAFVAAIRLAGLVE